MKITVTLNGQPQHFETSPATRLLDLLRRDARLTGTKEGCGEGECGACTVLLDGAPVNSCLIPAGHVDGRRVETIEGLGDAQALHAVQAALLAHGGAQCGICTPGIALSAAAAVRDNPQATRQEIRTALAGNLCRCTGYQRIIDAVAATTQPQDKP